MRQKRKSKCFAPGYDFHNIKGGRSEETKSLKDRRLSNGKGVLGIGPSEETGSSGIRTG